MTSATGIAPKAAERSESAGASGPSRSADDVEAERAAKRLADVIQNDLDNQPPEKRRALDGKPYTQIKFLQYFGEHDGDDYWRDARNDDTEIQPEDIHSILARSLWPMRGPQVCVITDGEILLEAATVPAADAAAEIFKTLLRARQAQFDAMQGVENPDAWSHSAGALQPGGREFTDDEFQEAYSRWRDQWIERMILTHEQEAERQTFFRRPSARRQGVGSRRGSTST